ncbi:hypothetical protein [Streptomyces sp. 6-11-2]|uniref:hypothetical protein n=1 Tax=Streptomyces sp. 6-11-2 TaxID=2585753 RepID=UPI001142C528|nr:hypothetical protein [Streptomyces sp. 6-11-2]
MKIRRWGSRGMSVLAVGGALVLMTACSGEAGKPGTTREAKTAAATAPTVKPDAATTPTVKPDEMRATRSAALQYTSFTAQETFAGGCVTDHQCQATLTLLQPLAAPVAQQLHDEAGLDPYYADLRDLADKVSEGVQETDPADLAAMDALLKDIVKLKERLDKEMDLGHF